MGDQKQNVTAEIRPAKDLKEVEALWWPLMKELGWNRSLHDAHTHVTSSGLSAWLMLVPSTADTPQGVVIPFVHDNSTGWLGFFIINAPYRGLGLGSQLFQAAKDHFKERGTQFVGLDGVAEQKKTYERRGFVETDQISLMIRKNTKDIPESQGELWEGESMVDLRDVAREDLVKTDLEYTGFERRKLWTDEALFDRKDVSGFAVLDSKNPDHPIKGWILMRGCQDGHRLGPIFAHCKEIASLLVHTAMKSVEGKDGSLIAEVWKSNKDAVPVMEHLQWEYAGMSYHRMWLDGKVPAAQRKGGKAETEMFAIFDAAEG